MLTLTQPGPFTAAPGAWTPASVVGIGGWWQPSSLVQVAGDPVGTWLDSSGLYRDLFQATASKKPLYRTVGGPNTSAFLDFDVADDTLTNVFALAWPMTVFAVFLQTTYTGGKVIYTGGLRQNPTSGTIRAQGISSGPAAVMGLGVWALTTTVFNGASSTLALNGGADVTGNCGAQPAITSFNFGPVDASVAEIILYTTVLSSTDQALVKAYLNTKYVLY